MFSRLWSRSFSSATKQFRFHSKPFDSKPRPFHHVNTLFKGFVSASLATIGVAVISQKNGDEEESQLIKKALAEPKKEKEKENYSNLYVPPSSESPFAIFAGNGNIALASEVAALLGTQLGRATIGKFQDGETKIQIHDSVRGKDVYLIQPTSFPTNDNLMELLLLISTFRRASANRVVAIVPYFAYARQLDKGGSQTIAAADVAVMMQSMGVDEIIAVDLHRNQVQGFFDAESPCVCLETSKLAAPYLASKKLVDPVIVTPVGDGVYRTKSLIKELSKYGVDASVALLYFQDDRSSFVESDIQHHSTISKQNHMEIVGDVEGKDVVFLDDMIDTASRVTAASECLKAHGAKRVFAYASHGLFTNDAMDRISKSELNEVVVFNTIPLSQEKWARQVQQLTISGLIAETIKRIHQERPLVDEE